MDDAGPKNTSRNIFNLSTLLQLHIHFQSQWVQIDPELKLRPLQYPAKDYGGPASEVKRMNLKEQGKSIQEIISISTFSDDSNQNQVPLEISSIADSVLKQPEDT